VSLLPTLTVPAGTPCPQGYVADVNQAFDPTLGAIPLDTLIANSLAGANLVNPSDLQISSACIPQPAVSVDGKWITQDDFLSVTVLAYVATSGLTLNARVLDCHGVTNYLSYNLDGAPIGVATTLVLALTPGYLIDVVVANLGGGLAPGTVSVTIGLQHSAQTGLQPTALLAQGYVSNTYALGYPGAPTGAPVTPATPAPLPPAGIRGTGIQCSSAQDFDVFWPAGTLAGDLAILVATGGYNTTDPAGWAVRNRLPGGTFNGGTWSKVLTGGDISAGKVTVHFAGSYNACLAIVTFNGATNWNPTAAYNYSNASSSFPLNITTNGSGTPAAGNTMLYVGTLRGNYDIAFSRGTKVNAANDNTAASGAIYGETLAADGAITVAEQLSGGNSIDTAYGVVLCIQL
jgi:hypothetical protein